MKIPSDWPIQPLKKGEKAEDRNTCGTCGLSWDDAIVTSMTPVPSARCPFEAFHEESLSNLEDIDEEFNLESIATDAAYAMKQLKMALAGRIDAKAQDCITRAMDAIERIQDRTKPSE